MEDIYDGQVFANLMRYGSFLSFSENVGLILCTDGVPIFKASSGSLWPIYFAVTSIRPQDRMRMKQLIVAALWHGPCKPVMDIILQPIFDCIDKIFHHGIVVNGVILRAKVLMGVFDLPAKATATHTKQYNGEYGCFYCIHPGEMYERARIYPPCASYTLRTPDQMKRWAAEAEQTGKAVYGVKGNSILAKYMEFPGCVPIDYMHSILEGVFKQVFKRFFNSTYHGKAYSIRKHIHTIDKCVSQVLPPKEIPRMPRSIDHISFYKASEYHSWMLYYSLPILSHFLNPEFVHHLSLLVTAMHILLSNKIKRDELAIAENMLLTFHNLAGNFYSKSIYTANMHSLVHTVDMVRLWGPLWCFSMFGFENMNGILVNNFHGTRKIVQQMAFQLQLKQSLPKVLKEQCEGESPHTQEYLQKITDEKKRSMYLIEEGCYSIGKLLSDDLSNEEIHAVSAIGIPLQNTNVIRFGRIMLHGTYFYSRLYKKNTRRNDIRSYSVHEAVHYGEILSYCTLHPLTAQASNICFIERYNLTNTTPVSTIPPPRHQELRSIPVHDILSTRIVGVKKSSDIVAVALGNILKKCIKIPRVLRDGIDYIIPLPNNYEVH